MRDSLRSWFVTNEEFQTQDRGVQRKDCRIRQVGRKTSPDRGRDSLDESL